MKLFILFIFLHGTCAYAQTISRNWNHTLEEAVGQFKRCEDTSTTGVSSCNAFIGQTLKTVYQLNDFYSAKEGRYMRINEIYDYLQHSKQWMLLGKGYEQKALTEAQSLANGKKAVVAVYLTGTDIGHLAYILPGELKLSGSWGIQVPNSAAYFTSEPEKSYVNKGLSYSFPRRLMTEVYLYARTK